MKKYLSVLFMVGVLIVMTGCDVFASKEDVMKEYAIDLYENHLKGYDVSNQKITIADLKKAVDSVGKDYDMKKLEKCTDESYAELIIDTNTKEVTNVNFNLECE